MTLSNNDKNRIRIEAAARSIYLDEKELLITRAHERTIVGILFCLIKDDFKKEGWDIDIEYNREGLEGDSKGDDLGLIIPDLIVHKRGVLGQEGNLLALQVKCYWNKTPRSDDRQKLLRLKNKFDYQFLYQLELNQNDFILSEINALS